MKSRLPCIGSVRNLLGALLVAVASSACSTLPYDVDTNLTDSKFTPKGKSIAVISGLREPANVAVAELVGESLRKKSRFAVISQAQVARKVPGYPMRIKGPYKSAYMSILTDWDLGDRAKIAEIQRTLGVDYVYVIWTPIVGEWNDSKVTDIQAVAQLFEAPGAKVVAQSSIELMDGDKKDTKTYLTQGVDEVARQLATKTHMLIAPK